MSAKESSSLKDLLPGLLLLSMSILGLILANSSLQTHYNALLTWPVEFILGPLAIKKNVILFINDYMMAIFFLFVGLELKREILVGELSEGDQARLPIFAGLGGMVFPAALFLMLNMGAETSSGWGIPMATDIAFALGVLMVLGSRVPLQLKVFLTAVAVVDDLAAILVIAVFYTEEINLTMLLLGGATWIGLLVLNFAGNVRTSVYVMLGFVLWYFFLKSGVHATIAGVLLALAIPTNYGRRLDKSTMMDVLQKKRQVTDSPLVLVEKTLAPWVGFVILPIFAFANSGVVFTDFGLSVFGVGIVLGLVIGKPLGIVGMTWLSTKLGWCSPLPVSWRGIIGVGSVAGIGFTMSLFITNLAFVDAVIVNEAKGAVLIGSLISGVIGIGILLSGDLKAAPQKNN